MTYFTSWRGLGGLGFESMFEAFESFSDQQNNYPPYNLIQDGDDYRIEIAVAGFKEEDLSLEQRENKLILESRVLPKLDLSAKYVHRGIAGRYFKREWLLHDDIVVLTAELDDGLLVIRLQKIIPEEKKPKTIKITS
jgi:molecular chaperone IbpA